MKWVVAAPATQFCALLVASTLMAGPPSQAGQSASGDLAPPGGWKLTDLAGTMNSLSGRSYTAGKRLFDQAHCTTCHRQENVGNEFGPDLAKLDPRFQPLDILRDILDPSRRIADAKYDLWIFVTDSGRVVTGLVEAENDRIVKVMEKPPSISPPIMLQKPKIEERKMSLGSIMPQGLLDNLTREEIADLVAYIAARGDPTDLRCQPVAVAGP